MQQVPWEYQLAVADYWKGRPAAMGPAATAWVPGLPLEMTVTAPAASHGDLAVSSSGRQQLAVVGSTTDHHQYEWSGPVEAFEQAARAFEDNLGRTETKIHLFPASMGGLAERYAAPRAVSIGPYHHGRSPTVLRMESTKHVAAWHFVRSSGRPVEELYAAVCAVADEARGCYDEDRVRGLADDDFKPMMFFDGCFLLQYLLFVCRDGDEDEGMAVDPALRSAFSSDYDRISSDVVLLENQLPWVVVETLMSFVPAPGLDLPKLVGRVKGSLQALDEKPPAWDSSYTPPHLLGLLRYYIVGTSTKLSSESSRGLSEKAKKVSISVSAVELAEMGIQLTATKTGAELKEMGVKRALLSGELFLAPLLLDDANAGFLVNMAALELCTTPNFADADDERSTVCSYLCLLGMVTDRVEDVQELRTNHILQGGAGLTNEDALGLFISLEKHLRPGRCYLRTMHYWNFRIRRVPGSSPRAKARALGKLTDAESISRQQTYLGKHNILLRVVLGKRGRLGKGTLCREPSSRRMAKCYHVAHPVANDGTVTVALLYREPFSEKLQLYLHSY